MTVCGVGEYVPYNNYVCRENNKITKEYTLWADMFTRCYTSYYPTYKDCFVCDDWHRSDNFWIWAEKQVSFLREGYYLDKDLLVPGNKMYVPDACVFIPRNLNQFLCGADAIRGDCPKGISFDTKRSKFAAKISIDNKTLNLGRFEELEDAKAAYAKAKTEEGRRWGVRLKTEGYEVDPRVLKFLEGYNFSHEDDI